MKILLPRLSPCSSLPHLPLLSTSHMAVNIYVLTAPLHAHPFKVPHRSGSPLQTCTPKWLSIPTFLTLVDGSAVLPVAQPRPWIALESFLSNFPSALLGNSLDSAFKLYPFLPSWLLLSQSACPSPLSWIVTIVAPSSLLPLLGTLLYILNTGSRVSL